MSDVAVVLTTGLGQVGRAAAEVAGACFLGLVALKCLILAWNLAAARRLSRRGRHAATQPAEVTEADGGEVGDDTLAMLARWRADGDVTFLADGLADELGRMLREDGRD
ncbi:MAG: hypothetical protein ACRDVE_15325 [Actinocrinis sp.]